MLQDFLAVGEVTPDEAAGAAGAQDERLVPFADTERKVINVEFLRALLSELPDIPEDIADLLREHRELVLHSGSTDVSLHPRN